MTAWRYGIAIVPSRRYVRKLNDGFRQILSGTAAQRKALKERVAQLKASAA